MSLGSLGDEKQQLRQTLRVKRSALAAAQPGFGARIAGYANDLGAAPSDVIGLYRALPGEADPGQLAQVLQARGHLLALPRVVAGGQPLAFHAYSPGGLLTRGPFGVEEPLANAPPLTPDIVLVPLLGFDNQGYRLGYGGGYYDRTLAILREAGRVIVVGIAFAGQEIGAIPRDIHDQPLDAVLTENGLRQINIPAAGAS